MQRGALRGAPKGRRTDRLHPSSHYATVQAKAGRLAAEHFVERRFGELGIVTYNASNPS